MQANFYVYLIWVSVGCYPLLTGLVLWKPEKAHMTLLAASFRAWTTKNTAHIHGRNLFLESGVTDAVYCEKTFVFSLLSLGQRGASCSGMSFIETLPHGYFRILLTRYIFRFSRPQRLMKPQIVKICCHFEVALLDIQFFTGMSCYTVFASCPVRSHDWTLFLVKMKFVKEMCTNTAAGSQQSM